MLHSSWYQDTLPLFHFYYTISEFDSKFTFPDHKEFVFVGMMMPRELALQLDYPYFLSI